MVNELLFEQLFRMYYAELCRYASRYLSDKQIVEDIVQSFFLDFFLYMNIVSILIVRMLT